MTLKVTPRRLDLLGWVDQGEVWMQHNEHSVRTNTEEFGQRDFVEQVSQEMADFEAAGLAVVVELPSGLRRWDLTDAGREVLAQAEKEK